LRRPFPRSILGAAPHLRRSSGELAFAAISLAAMLIGCVSPPAVELHRYAFNQPQMGVPFRIVLYAPDEATATRAAEAAFARIGELNERLSDYSDDSELTRLSRTSGSGQAVRLSDDLWRVLERAQQFAARSGGAFDVTVGPCVNQWRRARRQRALPPPAQLAAARQAVGYQHLVLDPKARTATLAVPSMRLDLGGIGKGFAADEALEVLRELGLRRALVTAAGDMTAGEAPPGKAGWRVEIAPLDVPGAPPARYVLLDQAALATSGDLYQHVEIDGVRYSHIVDPRTGLGLTDHSLVTVIARDGTTADALATSVSVLGPQAGLRLVEQVPGAAAVIVRKPGDKIEVYESRRFKRFLDPAPRRRVSRYGPGGPTGCPRRCGRRLRPGPPSPDRVARRSPPR